MRQSRGCMSRLLLVLLLAGFALGAWALAEPYMLRVREETLVYPDLPEAFEGLRVVFLSDIHWGPLYGDKRVDRLVQRVNDLSPDVILLGGDYANTSEGAIAFFERRPEFQAAMGVYAIPGNHDRTVPESNRRRLIDSMWEAGVIPLYNAYYRLERQGQFLYLAGVDDLKTGHPDFEGLGASLYREDFVILLSHDPDSVPLILESPDARGQRGWADLILCGHTHGGQINFGRYSPFLRRVVRNERYRYGLLREEDSDVLITSGIGTSVVPARLMAQPEICLLTLRRGSRI